MNTHVIGVNGCRGGWMVCRLNVSTLAIDLIGVARSLRDVLAREVSSTHFAVDIPIGLPEIGFARQCDLQARKLLGKARSSTVFPAPPRDLLQKRDYSEANAHSRAICGTGISKQAHAIFARVAEVDEIMTPELQGRLFEVHPELCFWGLTGEPMQHAKRFLEGYEERRRVLNRLLSVSLPERSAVRQFGLPIEPDDLLDALVAAFTAYRAWKGDAVHIPEHPQLDLKGLRMEMVY